MKCVDDPEVIDEFGAAYATKAMGSRLEYCMRI
jgi:hypothetical protein